ncbi:MAG: protein kinase [Polyangiaceae bacterium]|nr:protein kinase [Polyangiaceae bacterium]
MDEREYRRIEETARARERNKEFSAAARSYADIGQLGHAARCYLAANDKTAALQTVLRIPREDPLYRDACVLAIRLSVNLNRVDFDFDQFVGRFLSSQPANDTELEAFYTAAVLFDDNGFAENAREVYAKVVDAAPQYKDARQRMDAIERNSRPSFAMLKRIVDEDDAFRRADRERPLSSAPPPGHSAADNETFPSLPEIPIPPTRMTTPAGARPARSSVPPPRPGRDQPTIAGPSSNPPVSSRQPRRPSPNPSPRPARGAEGSLASPDEWRSAPRLRPLQDIFAIAPGFIIAERYRVDSLIGRGGMAVVYRAHDLELDETIAIKLFAHGMSDPTLLSRFKQELALCRQVSHENVIRLYDIGSHNDARFITMELLSGADLCDRLEQGRDLVRDLGWLVQLCDGLQCVHEKGVVHRDLKPENIFVTNDDVVKLMDFGIAKRRTTEGGITMEGFSAGTPAYMAPEQINNFASVTHLSDLYSIGVIAYQMFAGVLPFASEMAMAVLVKQLNELPAPPSTHEPTIPDELEYLILQLLEKDPKRRVQSCRELARDLRELRSRLVARRKPRAPSAR